jgi:ankyrin repeat protein
MKNTFNQRLCQAVWREDLDEAREMILLGADVNCFDENGQTPLHLAVEQENIELVGMLLDAGADLELSSKGGYWTPLLHAVARVGDSASQLQRSADNQLVRFMINRGANVLGEDVEW